MPTTFKMIISEMSYKQLSKIKIWENSLKGISMEKFPQDKTDLWWKQEIAGKHEQEKE